jgi:hypothetical protein
MGSEKYYEAYKRVAEKNKEQLKKGYCGSTNELYFKQGYLLAKAEMKQQILDAENAIRYLHPGATTYADELAKKYWEKYGK